MLSVDRLKAALNALVRATFPRFAYAAPRFAKVVKATNHGSATFLDVVPEDPTFPSMPGVPLFHGLPGVELTLAAGTRVLVEFSEADPARPFVRSWAGGEVVTVLSVGGEGAMAPVLDPLLAPYLKAISKHVHAGVMTGGGVSGVSVELATVPPVAATVVRVK